MSNLLSVIPGFGKAPAVSSVAKILESFNTVVNQLEDAAAQHKLLAQQHAQTAQDAMMAKAASDAEVAAAQTAVQNIRALIGT